MRFEARHNIEDGPAHEAGAADDQSMEILDAARGELQGSGFNRSAGTRRELAEGEGRRREAKRRRGQTLLRVRKGTRRRTRRLSEDGGGAGDVGMMRTTSPGWIRTKGRPEAANRGLTNRRPGDQCSGARRSRADA